MERLSNAIVRRRIRIREASGQDAAALDQVFAGLSPEGRRMRYLTSLPRLPRAMRRALLDLDPDRHVVLVAEVGGEAIGLARYVIDGPGRAELAYEVVDAWQGRGVGTRLLRRLVEVARERGVASLHGTLLPENRASLGLLRRVLPQLRVTPGEQEVQVEAALHVGALTDAGTEVWTLRDLVPVV